MGEEEEEVAGQCPDTPRLGLPPAALNPFSTALNLSANALNPFSNSSAASPIGNGSTALHQSSPENQQQNQNQNQQQQQNQQNQQQSPWRAYPSFSAMLRPSSSQRAISRDQQLPQQQQVRGNRRAG